MTNVQAKLSTEAHDIFAMMETMFPSAVFHPVESDNTFKFRVGADNYEVNVHEHRLTFKHRGTVKFTIENPLCGTVFLQRAYSFIKVRRDERAKREAYRLRKSA